MSYLSIRDYLEPLLGVKLSASPAELQSAGISCKLDISSAEDITQLDGIPITSFRNAQDVIDTIKVTSGLTAKLSKLSSKADLKSYCEELNSVESLLRKIMPERSYRIPCLSEERVLQKLSTLTREELTELASLRKRRIELLSTSEAYEGIYYNERKRINYRLFQLTGWKPYCTDIDHADDTDEANPRP